VREYLFLQCKEKRERVNLLKYLNSFWFSGNLGSNKDLWNVNNSYLGQHNFNNLYRGVLVHFHRVQLQQVKFSLKLAESVKTPQCLVQKIW
jgi:hypothetical protein